MLASAFVNEDGSTAVVVMNCGDRDVPAMVYDRDRMVQVDSLAHSIMTLVYE